MSRSFPREFPGVWSSRSYQRGRSIVLFFFSGKVNLVEDLEGIVPAPTLGGRLWSSRWAEQESTGRGYRRYGRVGQEK